VNKIHQQLVAEEHELAKQGGVPSNISPASFVVSGLAIEDAQYESVSFTNLQVTNKRSQAHSAGREIQPTYMPGLWAHLARTTSKASNNDTSCPELMALHLPSFFDAQVRDTICLSGIPLIED
ncbi:hypothetical protein L208DRAFT_1310611, partial [Tricholoma matsutake]